MVVANRKLNGAEMVMPYHKPRAALYVRVSTEEQRKEGFSLGAQEEILRAYCESRGFEVYDLYSDGGYSGKNFDRPAMQQLLRDVDQDKFDIVLTVAVDRISRNNKEALTFIDDELHSRGKKLIVSTCDIDSSTDTGKMFISLLGTFAEYERRLIISRVKKGMEKRASEGKFNGGLMLGYNVINGALVVNEDEAETVREIFELRALGKGYKSIVNILNRKGKKTKGTTHKPSGSFSTCAVKTILDNEKYTGSLDWGKKRDWSIKRRKGVSEPIKVKGEHDAIIDPELWNKVQAVNQLQKKASLSQSNFKGEFILSGLLRCPVCNAGTVMSKSKKRDGSGYHLYYMCQNFHAKGKSVCSSNLVNKELVEGQVLQFIRTVLADESIVEGIMERLRSEETKSTAQLERDLHIQQTSLKKLLEKQRKQDDDYYANVISATVYNRLSEAVEAEIIQQQQIVANIEREIDKVQSTVILNKEIIVEALKNFDELFDAATNEEKRSLLRALIKEIHMESNRKSIKNIVFWFTEDDGLAQTALPEQGTRRTVP
ncbi:hypothetical protein J19TS2_17420 [Cohnella xylanilytica]|uniref:recombinase family protein n=1 Tax=Cohnella xylanilytica TaxID=557555 RepID=UPI001B0B6D0D|nr:recombinase family protein [Cohnella xylanilytica]GIO12187.1 hypothetical protein J19TS2_17420 [Cohnella xylanilytica]